MSNKVLFNTTLKTICYLPKYIYIYIYLLVHLFSIRESNQNDNTMMCGWLSVSTDNREGRSSNSFPIISHPIDTLPPINVGVSTKISYLVQFKRFIKMLQYYVWINLYILSLKHFHEKDFANQTPLKNTISSCMDLISLST